MNQFLLDSFGVGFRFIDLIDRHDHRNTGGLGVGNGFFGLRHHTVVGGHHQNHNIGSLSAACTHCRKCFVPRRIQECHDAAWGLDVVRTDVLGNATGFTGRHFGAADVVKQTRLTVVNVTHDGHHRRTRQSLCRIFFHHVA